MNNSKKRIDIAVVGDVASGKTFVIEAMVNILSNLKNKFYKPIASDMFEINRTTNGLSDSSFFEELNTSFRNATGVHSPEYLYDLIDLNIHQTSEIKTEPKGALYSALLNKSGEKHTFISFYNISGEAFQHFFEPLPNFSNEGESRPIDLMKKMDQNQKKFWAQDWNNSWQSFEAVLRQFYEERDVPFDENAQLNFTDNLKPFYSSFLYACNATDVIFCTDGQTRAFVLNPNQVASMNDFLGSGSKNYYQILTKFDRFLKKKVQLSSLSDFEEYYANVLLKIIKREYNDPLFTLDQSLITELRNHSRLFGGFLNEGVDKSCENEIKQYVVACNLMYDNIDDESEFILFHDETSSQENLWNQKMNLVRRSIGIRELLSTIFYNNNNNDEIGNLEIVNEFLRKFYYS